MDYVNNPNPVNICLHHFLDYFQFKVFLHVICIVFKVAEVYNFSSKNIIRPLSLFSPHTERI